MSEASERSEVAWKVALQAAHRNGDQGREVAALEREAAALAAEAWAAEWERQAAGGGIRDVACLQASAARVIAKSIRAREPGRP